MYKKMSNFLPILTVPLFLFTLFGKFFIWWFIRRKKAVSGYTILCATISWYFLVIEYNAKCRHPKKLTCKGTLQQVFICLRPRTPYPSFTVYLFTQEGGKGEELNQREG
jgi:hypothetical protein